MVLALVRAQPRIDLEALVLLGDQGGDRVGLDRLGGRVTRSPGAIASICGPSVRSNVCTSTRMSPIPFMA